MGSRSRRSLTAPALAALVASGTPACKPAPVAERDAAIPGPTAPAIADAAPVVTPAPVDAAAPSAMATRRPRLPCRAIALTGRVSTGDAGALGSGAELDPAAWLDLADGARLTAKDPRTGRETALVGVARARVCRDGDEEVWLARGTLESSPRSAMLPGAEEWVITPLGAFRFGAASVAITVDAAAKEARASVTSGSAFAWYPPHVAREPGAAPTADAGGDPWIRLDGGGKAVLRDRAGDPATTRDAAVACRDLAERARGLAVRLASPEGHRMIVELAAQQASARVVARAACAVAELRIALLPPAPATGAGGPTTAADLTAMVRAADAAWRGFP
jgi:hypothetical protein